ncbi:hypothetical protein OQE62_01500 [Microbulbifer halophilus]|nr:hypothetical protein [Microbulbifer halophilus]MCW8125236.1 hypothetical protein [Microbulbifer halophilus]
MGAIEVSGWLIHLAGRCSVAINTQKTALNAVAFLYKQFIRLDIGDPEFNRTNRARTGWQRH